MKTTEEKQDKNKKLTPEELEDTNGGIYSLTKNKRQDGFRASAFDDVFPIEQNLN